MTSTPNMLLQVPQPGVTPAPDWGTEQQTAMGLVDTHDHSSDKGVQVPTAGINVNDDLSLRGYGLKDVHNVTLLAVSAEGARYSVYAKGVDLYFRDGSGSEIRLTQNGAVNGTGGGGTGGPQTSFSVDSVASLKSLSQVQCLTNAVYGTLGYTTPYDGGAWPNYQWRPLDTTTSDDALSIRPVFVASDAAPGRFRYVPANNTFEARCSDLDWTGQVDSWTRFTQLLAACETFGIARFLQPPGDLYVGNHGPIAPENIEICGAGKGRTRWRSDITSTGQVATVRLITLTPLPACIATGAGPTKTITAIVNGALSVDSKAVNVNDRILVAQQANAIDNGVYVVTATGSAGTKFVLTRAADFNTSRTLCQRMGIRSTDGAPVLPSNEQALYVLSRLPNKRYDTQSMVMDVTPQYWTAEDWLPGGFSLIPTCEIPIFLAGAPYYLATHWDNWTQAGDRVLPNVQGLNGGSWLNPGDGITYPFAAPVAGDKWFIEVGGTPTDQNYMYWSQKVTVRGIDPVTGNVTVDPPIPVMPPRIFSYPAGTVGFYPQGVVSLGTVSAVGANQITLTTVANAGGLTAGQSITCPTRVGVGIVVSGNPGTGVIVFNAGTMPPFRIGDTVLRSESFPAYNTNYGRHNADNTWRRIVKDCNNVTIRDMTFDGVSLNFAFTSNTRMERVEIANVHVGTFFTGTISQRTIGLTMRNVTGLHFPTSPGLTDVAWWYGWAIQNNGCIDSQITDFLADGLFTHLVDQEVENETRWTDVNVILGPPDLNYAACFIAGTTPRSTKQNPVVNLTVRGVMQSLGIIISQPVLNLTYDVPTSLGYMGVLCSVNSISGYLIFKGRKYLMNQRIRWRMRIPLGPTIDRSYVRPYDGLWSNTRMWFSSVVGITSMEINTALAPGGFDLNGFVQTLAPQTWSVVAGDQLGSLGGAYPNSGDSDHQSIRVVTDGTSPVGAYMLIESDCIPQVDRGDGYMGVGIGASANKSVVFTDSSLLWEFQGAGSPVGAQTPLFIGQRYFDRVALQYWESIGLTAADWVRMTF